MYQFLFRMRYKELGAHTHIRFFSGKGSLSLGLCGNLVMRNEEWAEFKQWCDRQGPVEILPEEL